MIKKASAPAGVFHFLFNVEGRVAPGPLRIWSLEGLVHQVDLYGPSIRYNEPIYQESQYWPEDAAGSPPRRECHCISRSLGRWVVQPGDGEGDGEGDDEVLGHETPPAAFKGPYGSPSKVWQTVTIVPVVHVGVGLGVGSGVGWHGPPAGRWVVPGVGCCRAATTRSIGVKLWRWLSDTVLSLP